MLSILKDEDVHLRRRLTEEQFFYLIHHIKKNENVENEGDTEDAFVAMGGGDKDSTKEGYVDAGKLIKIIKEEFEMTIDIEKLIKEIDEDGSGKIEYGEFKSLLNSS